MDLKRLDWILIKAQDTELTAWEENFIADMTERREKYGDDIRISDAQRETLERIAAK